MTNGTGPLAEFMYPRSLVYGGSASALSSGSPYGITYDATSNLIYVSDKYGYKLRMISLVTGVVATVAGTGASGSNNVTAGLGTDVSFNQFEGLTVDPMDHDLFIADYGNFVVRHLY